MWKMMNGYCERWWRVTVKDGEVYIEKWWRGSVKEVVWKVMMSKFYLQWKRSVKSDDEEVWWCSVGVKGNEVSAYTIPCHISYHSSILCTLWLTALSLALCFSYQTRKQYKHTLMLFLCYTISKLETYIKTIQLHEILYNIILLYITLNYHFQVKWC